jgi:hypothetical protein
VASEEDGLNASEKLELLMANELLWSMGERMPTKEEGTPGAPRHFPEWVWLLFAGCVSIDRSARKVAGEMRSRWPAIVAVARQRYADRPDLWPPPKPPRRHHWQYAKLRLKEEEQLRALISAFETGSAVQAVEMGIADANGGGSLSHPDPQRCLTGDGKVITPLYRAKPDTAIVDKETGEVLGYKKADPTAKLHVEGGGNTAWGNKVVMISGRTPDWHGRMILGLGSCPKLGGEAKVAVEIMERIRPSLPGAQALIYDGAPRGVHVRRLLQQAGILLISPPTADQAKTPESSRVEKSGFIETRDINGRQVSFYGFGSRIGLADFDAEGNDVFVPLERLQIKQARNTDGTYRWYGRYRLPDSHGGEDIWIRADTTDADLARKPKPVNRSENFRLIPPGDPDYEELYGLRPDSEANNRQLEDTLWINRAHSNGDDAQLLDLLGYALLYNSIAIGLHRLRAGEPPGLAEAA